MRRVLQTRTAIDLEGMEAPGNCFQACLASILNLAIDDVPDEITFWQPGRPPKETWPLYWTCIVTWLDAEYGLYPFELKLTEGDIPRVYHIVSGPSPRNPNIDHCVVGYGQMLFWDPHPSMQYLRDGPRTHMFLVAGMN